MSLMKREDIRNVAIIAHVDHGKTTLVDGMLRQSGVFRDNQEVRERVMDSGAIERERGITILSKNTAIEYNGVKINIVDTPGHADFGGEVERVLKMVNGVILLVDAFEGTMPQTKFVLKKALALDLPVIVCINKIDRPEARPEEVVDEVLELFMDLDASDEQLECPFLYASAREGTCSRDPYEEGTDLKPLFETIIDYIPAPEGDPEKGTQVLISTIDYNEYVGRIGIGKVENGKIYVGQEIVRVNYHDPGVREKTKITKLYEFDGLKKVDVREAEVGSIVAVSGIAGLQIGDTICTPGEEDAIPFQKISEPTIAMNFIVNDSPFAGREGEYCTSRQIRERLMRELNTDVSLRVEDTENTDTFKVSGRGELHLSVLMTVISMLSERKGELLSMDTLSDGTTRLEFMIPARGLIGIHGNLLTATRGTAVLNSVFEKYAPYKGDITFRKNGSLIAFEDGEAVTYGLFAAQERGALFISPGTKVYAGMVVGESAKPEEIEINVCKTKHLTNTRSSSADEALILTPPRIFSLEQALDYIDSDELLEVTPKSLRIRKRILDARLRKRANINK